MLKNSRATEAFKQAVLDFQQGRAVECIQNNPGPPIKVLRVIRNLLDERPDLEIERIEIEGHSGCSSYAGALRVWPGPLEIEFEWDCRWKAEELGWEDCYGLADQGRASREFEYKCFRKFDLKTSAN